MCVCFHLSSDYLNTLKSKYELIELAKNKDSRVGYPYPEDEYECL